MGTWVRLMGLCVVAVAAGVVATSGCLDRPLCAASSSIDPKVVAQGCTPKTTNVFVDTVQQTSVDKIDLLLMIDNSISMADKQEILKAAVPDLVGRLVNPVCVATDGSGGTIRDVETDCPAGYDREFQPIRDIHIGIITSSLYVGSDLCHPTQNPQSMKTGTPNPMLDDSAWLLGARPRTAGMVQGVSPEGFLNWNRNDNPSQSAAAFSQSVQGLVGQAGENGCGFESTLEAWYRFLIDPAPYARIELAACAQNPGLDCAYPAEVDNDLLAQRAAFLRPDSLVAVIMLSDENDCSIQGVDQLYYIATQNFSIPRASAACAQNPNDPCCYSCGLGPPSTCAAPDPSPECANAEQVPAPDREINLRCWEQKRRFGFEFLYPTDRYVNALKERSLCLARSDLAVVDDQGNNICPEGAVAANGLFVDVNGVATRAADLVFLAGIIGVPWQDIQATQDDEGNPYPAGDLRYLTASQMTQQDLWPRIVPTDRNGLLVEPADKLMVESRAARGGSNPVTMEPLQPPSAGYLANSINGHEWVSSRDDDLMYACIFPLAMPRDCQAVLDQNENAGCDCPPGGADVEFNPLCQAPDGSYSVVQRFAKAYPGTRELEVLRDFGNNSIVASICARNVDNPDAQDFGYRPAVDAIVDRLKEKLSGRCLPRELDRDPETSEVPCVLIEALPNGMGACAERPARSDVPAALVTPALDRLKAAEICGTGPGQLPCSAAAFQLCEIQQLPDLNSPCQQLDSGEATGWCYIDDPMNANVSNCPATEKRLLRFVDPLGQTPAKGATVLVACRGGTLSDTTVSMAP